MDETGRGEGKARGRGCSGVIVPAICGDRVGVRMRSIVKGWRVVV